MKQRLARIAKASFYGGLTLRIVVVTVLLVTIGRGYFFDFRTGQLSGGGLVLLDSDPANAQVYLDGKDLRKNSPTRLTLKAGNYQMRLVRDGYRPWQKDLTVVTSEVTWAQYPFLLPNDITTQPLLDLPSPVVIKQSPDQNRLAIASSAA